MNVVTKVVYNTIQTKSEGSNKIYNYQINMQANIIVQNYLYIFKTENFSSIILRFALCKKQPKQYTYFIIKMLNIN